MVRTIVYPKCRGSNLSGRAVVRGESHLSNENKEQ